MDNSCTREQVKKLANGAVLVVGDIMLDHYLIGDVERISPEAPVPVVNVQDESLFLGGAGNVAQNIASLGGQALLVSVCGKDNAADLLQAKLEQCNVDTRLLQMDDRPTTQKTRVLARRQQMLRFDREKIAPLAACDISRVLAAVEELLPVAGSILVSDYGKGLVSSKLMDGLHTLVGQSEKKIPILIDPKPQNIHCYQTVSLLTPNTKEASELAGLPTNTKEEVLSAGRAIMASLKLEHLVITLGAEGMVVFKSSEDVWHLPTSAKEVFDVTGAGDTVIATTALGLAAGLDLLQACSIANIAAGIVVGQVGTATASLEAILNILKNSYAIHPVRWS